MEGIALCLTHRKVIMENIVLCPTGGMLERITDFDVLHYNLDRLLCTMLDKRWTTFGRRWTTVATVAVTTADTDVSASEFGVIPGWL